MTTHTIIYSVSFSTLSYISWYFSVCMYVFIYTYVWMYVCTYTYIRMYMCTYPCRYMHLCLDTYICVCLIDAEVYTDLPDLVLNLHERSCIFWPPPTLIPHLPLYFYFSFVIILKSRSAFQASVLSHPPNSPSAPLSPSLSLTILLPSSYRTLPSPSPSPSHPAFPAFCSPL